MKYKYILLFIIITIFNSQAGKLTKAEENLLQKEYEKILLMLENFYKQPIDNITISKKSVKIVYDYFINQLTKGELEVVQEWAKKDLPKWLLEGDKK